MIPRKLLIVVLAIAFSSCLLGQFTGDGFKNKVVGSKHDLSVNGAVSGATAVCEFCHAPHKIASMGGSGPTPAVPLLWNVQLPTATSYKVYGGSSTFDATDLRDPASAGPTKLAAYMTLLCLSCHDGSISASSFYYTDVLGTIGTISPPVIGDGGGLGLSNDHPVDFTYSVALATADGGIQSPTEGVGVRIPYVGKTTPLPLFKDQSSDPSGRMECATCHNPHDSTNDPFLRKDNTGSGLCLNCHGN